MKQNKAFLKINNHTFLEEIINKLKPFVSNIILNFNISTFHLYEQNYSLFKEQNLSLFENKYFLEIFDEDTIKGNFIRGPLIGLYSISKKLYSEFPNYHILLIAVDQISISYNLIKYSLKYLNNYDFIFYKYSDFIHFLPGFYKDNSFKFIEEYISNNKSNSYSLKNFVNYLYTLENVKIKTIEEKEIKKADKKGLSFFRVNTTIDYQNLLKNLIN